MSDPTVSSMEVVKENIITFIRDTFSRQKMDNAVIAVSGGIDSAVALTLLTQALGKSAVNPILLPYAQQDMSDAIEICRFNQFQDGDWLTMNIQSVVDQLCDMRAIDEADRVRRGNVMARIRMIMVFDYAKEKQALVCGTENKSEKHLGYFTRFGDAASDVEPINVLYKTQVRALAQHLGLPEHLCTKTPSAGLWADQTDEAELGFSYAEADIVLQQLVDEGRKPSEIAPEGIAIETVANILKQVQKNHFKQQVPYVTQLTISDFDGAAVRW